MTLPADWRKRAARTMADIRATPTEPYREGKPVRRVISVPGRRTGQPRPFGMNVIQVDGHLYVCSATRKRDWVRNLVIAGGCTVERDGDADYTATMIEGVEAARAMATYLVEERQRDLDLPFPIDATIEEITPHTATVAVIRLDPR